MRAIHGENDCNSWNVCTVDGGIFSDENHGVARITDYVPFHYSIGAECPRPGEKDTNQETYFSICQATQQHEYKQENSSTNADDAVLV